MSGHILTGPPGMPTSISVRLDRALAATDDGKFLRQLAEIDPRFDVVDLQDRPESLAVFGGLWILHLDVQLDGIWKYLAQTEGDTFGSALRGAAISERSARWRISRPRGGCSPAGGFNPTPLNGRTSSRSSRARRSRAAALTPWFIASASKLSRAQWTTVAQRSHRAPAAVQKALGHAKGLFAITDTLPRQATAGGRKIGLLFGAHHAAAASLAVRLHDWLRLTPEGREHARQAYAPFADLAWTPPI